MSISALRSGFLTRWVDIDLSDTSVAPATGCAGPLAITLWPSAAVVGRVDSADGAAVAGIDVTVIRRQVIAGVEYHEDAGRLRTDASGGFILDGLPPGDYAAAVIPEYASTPLAVASAFAGNSASMPAQLSFIGEAATLQSGLRIGETLLGVGRGVPAPSTLNGEWWIHDLAWAGAGFSTTASPQWVEVASGQRAHLEPIRLTSIKPRTLSGRLVGEGREVSRCAVQLFWKGESLPELRAAGTLSSESGGFTLAAVPPGIYEVRVARRGTGNGDCSGSAAVARIDADLTGSDIAGLEVPFSPTLRVTGTVEGGGDAIRTLRLYRVEDGGGPAQGAQARIGSNGSFSVSNLAAGRYVVLPDAADVLVESLMVDGTEIGPEIDVTADVVNVRVTLTNQTAELRGAVRAANPRATGAITVLVFPADKASWKGGLALANRFKQVAADIDGTFVVRGLPGGTYRTVALAGPVPAAWQTAGRLTSLIADATEVRLEKGQSTTLSLFALGSLR